MFPSLLSSCAFLFCSGLSLRLAFPSTSNLCFSGRLVSTPTVVGSNFVQVRPGRDRAILQYSCISGLPCAVSPSHSFQGSLSPEPHSCAARRADAGPPALAFLARGGQVCSDKRGTQEVRGSLPRYTPVPCWPSVNFVVGALFGLGVTSGNPAGEEGGFSSVETAG